MTEDLGRERCQHVEGFAQCCDPGMPCYVANVFFGVVDGELPEPDYWYCSGHSALYGFCRCCGFFNGDLCREMCDSCYAEVVDCDG